MKKGNDIVFYKAQDSGKGLPFAIVPHESLVSNNDLFTPSLRDFHVIFWIKKGSGKYFIDFQEYSMEPNTVILISKDHLHYFEHFTSSCELQSIVFNSEFIYRNDADLKHLFNFNTDRHVKGAQVLKLSEKNAEYLETISQQMLVVYNEWEGESRNESFYHLLCNFLIQCEQIQGILPTREIVDEDSRILMEFNNLLETNFREHSKVEFYISSLGLTVKTLSRIIKSKLNVSPKIVIDERRILEIKRQLKGTTKPVKEIAYELGFDEPTNMVKFFKKHVHMTPNSFRSE